MPRYRQDRTFLPPPEYNPLAPTPDPAQPDRAAGGRLGRRRVRQPLPGARRPAADGAARRCIVPTAPGRRPVRGRRLHAGPRRSLGALPLDHIELLLAGLGATARVRLGARDDIAYVLPFENRGAEVGVTLHHPHGQIYAYPVVPPVPARMQQMAREHYAAHGRGAARDA